MDVGQGEDRITIRTYPYWQQLYERGIVVYAALMCWCTYMILVPAVFAASHGAGVALVVFPGVYLSTLILYLHHESWHNYFGRPASRRLFEALCIVVFVPAHFFDVSHRSHHAKANTYDDLEFFPVGKIESRWRRMVFNTLSILLGTVFLLFFGGEGPRGMSWIESQCRLLASFLASCTLWVGLGVLSAALFHVSALDVAISYGLTLWFVSLVHRHNELIEHGNLIVEGDPAFRSAQTRNLSADGFFERIFLFFVHQDSREHTLHHTDVNRYSRPFVGRYELPRGAVTITFADYGAILKAMVLGRETVIRQELPRENQAA